MSRFKKILRGGLVALAAIIAAYGCLNALWNWRTDAQLKSRLDAIHQAGDPLSLAELARKPIPPETNAATCLEQAKEEISAILDESKPLHNDWLSTQKCEEFHVVLSPDIQKQLRSIFDAHANLMPLLEQVVSCSDYDSAMIGKYPSNMVPEKLAPFHEVLRHATHLLILRAILLASEGNCDESMHTALMMFRLARFSDGNPLFSSYLISTSIRVDAIKAANYAMQSGSISENNRSALMEELALCGNKENVISTVKGERAFVLDNLSLAPGRNNWLVQHWLWNLQTVAYLDEVNRFLTHVHTINTYKEAKIGFKYMGSLRDVDKMNENVFRMEASHQRRFAELALSRCLMVVDGLQQHGPWSEDTVPKLEGLGLSPETIVDPFNGEPLHVKRYLGGWLVYSVGSNLRDDGDGPDPCDGVERGVDTGLLPPKPPK
jgi:hypothetical protein